jgi:hypothetical protein
VGKTDWTETKIVQKVFEEMGVNVASGGLTTFAGVCVLGFSNSEVFRVFFKMFVGIVGFGLVHGLVLMPVLLSLLIRNPRKKRPGAVGSGANGVGGLLSLSRDLEAGEESSSSGVAAGGFVSNGAAMTAKATTATTTAPAGKPGEQQQHTSDTSSESTDSSSDASVDSV